VTNREKEMKMPITPIMRLTWDVKELEAQVAELQEQVRCLREVQVKVLIEKIQACQVENAKLRLNIMSKVERKGE